MRRHSHCGWQDSHARQQGTHTQRTRRVRGSAGSGDLTDPAHWSRTSRGLNMAHALVAKCMHEDTSAVSAWCFCNCSEGEDIMNLVPRNEPEAFLCQYADHIHSGTVGCTRRTLLGGLAALGAGALFTDRSASAQAAVNKP